LRNEGRGSGGGEEEEEEEEEQPKEEVEEKKIRISPWRREGKEDFGEAGGAYQPCDSGLIQSVVSR